MKSADTLRIDGIDRNNPVMIRVNGHPVRAYSGETLLAVLIAAGFRTLRSSPVLKEPRGGFCGMGICRECLAKVNGVPGVRACMTQVEDGMEVDLNG